MYRKSPDIIMITETWLSSAISDHEVFPTGYHVFRRDRGSRGGGVLIAVSSNLIASVVAKPDSCELIAARVLSAPPLLLLCTYAAPNSPSCYYENIISACSLLLCSFGPSSLLILAGDFNLPDVDWRILLPVRV